MANIMYITLMICLSTVKNMELGGKREIVQSITSQKKDVGLSVFGDVGLSVFGLAKRCWTLGFRVSKEMLDSRFPGQQRDAGLSVSGSAKRCWTLGFWASKECWTLGFLWAHVSSICKTARTYHLSAFLFSSFYFQKSAWVKWKAATLTYDITWLSSSNKGIIIDFLMEWLNTAARCPSTTGWSRDFVKITQVTRWVTVDQNSPVTNFVKITQVKRSVTVDQNSPVTNSSTNVTRLRESIDTDSLAILKTRSNRIRWNISKVKQESDSMRRIL